MSLSKAEDTGAAKPTTKRLTGKVLLGMPSGRTAELYLKDFEGGEQGVWNPESEAEFVDRVKKRAAAEAERIMNQARKEAGEIKRKAREQGLAEGFDQARKELDLARSEMGDKLAQAMQALEAGSKEIWEANRRDLVELVGLAVEKILARELDENRRGILAALLDQAMETLTGQRSLVIRAHPSDKESLEELLQAAVEKNPELTTWRVMPDQGMSPGGLVVESDQGVVDNSLEGRGEMVQAILDRLLPSLPENRS